MGRISNAYLWSGKYVRLWHIAPVSLVMSLRETPAFGANLHHKPIDLSQRLAKVAGAVERARARGPLRAGGSE